MSGIFKELTGSPILEEIRNKPKDELQICWQPILMSQRAHIPSAILNRICIIPFVSRWEFDSNLENSS